MIALATEMRANDVLGVISVGTPVALVANAIRPERPYIGRISRENRHYTETEPKLNRNSTETQYSLHPSFSLATYHPKTPQRIAKNNNKKNNSRNIKTTTIWHE